MARILLVDDEELLRETLREFLEREGHDVSEASDVPTAIQHCDEADLELLITDLVMPGQDGIEIIRHIKRQGKNTKILAISGRGGNSINANLTRALSFGADAGMHKPFSRDDLIGKVDELLGGEQADSPASPASSV